MRRKPIRNGFGERNPTTMKPKTMLKSLTRLFLRKVRPRPGKPGEPARMPEPTGEQQLQQALLLIEAEEGSGPTQYRHWGLNE